MWTRRFLEQRDLKGTQSPGEEDTLKLQYQAFGMDRGMRSTIWTLVRVGSSANTYPDESS